MKFFVLAANDQLKVWKEKCEKEVEEKKSTATNGEQQKPATTVAPVPAAPTKIKYVNISFSFLLFNCFF